MPDIALPKSAPFTLSSGQLPDELDVVAKHLEMIQPAYIAHLLRLAAEALRR